MEKPYLLHLITSEKNASPFDVNMAYDAGWTNITPYTNVEQSEIEALVQDAIFSRYRFANVHKVFKFCMLDPRC